ncbi:unnamed protein product [Amaranthus hypochondriacus]
MSQSKGNTKTSLVFKVTRRAPELIAPAGPTPYEFKELSDIDDQEGLRFHIPGIYFYRDDKHFGGSPLERRDPAKVLKEAVAKALVSYYPLAGRLREREGRKLVVECNGEGIVFIEGDADVSLDEFGDVLLPPFPCFDELLFDAPGTTAILGAPLVLMQDVEKMQL